LVSPTVSALAIAEALVIVGSDHARHVIVDAYHDLFYRSGWSAIAEAGLAGLCSLIEERSQTVLPRLMGEGFLADAAFVVDDRRDLAVGRPC